MASFAKAMIIGNLGRDPEMRYTPNGRPVTEFTVAVNQSTKNQQTGEWIEATDWYRVTVWGDRAERTAETLRKGNSVFVEGRFRTREYETREGQKRVSLEITADNVVGLERRAPGDESAGGSFGAQAPGVSPGAQAGGSSGGESVRPTRPQAPAPAPASRDDDFDDLPF